VQLPGDKGPNIPAIVDWYLDPQTDLPAVIGIRLPTFGHPMQCVEIFSGFASYSTLNGVYMPTQIATRDTPHMARQYQLRDLTFSLQ
jgi:hypothetical protein